VTRPLRFCCLLVLLALAGRAAGDELSDRLALADLDKGRRLFGACRVCHSLDPARGHGNGPNLAEIFGKVAGKQAGFENYSPVFRQAQFVWTPNFMYGWLADPMAMFPGSSMMSLGLQDPQDRADLIAYLMQATVPVD